MEPAIDIIDDATLEFTFNSEFARSLSTDMNKYDSEFSNETESVENGSKDEEFMIETSSFFIENVNKSDEDKEKQLWNQNNKKTKRQVKKFNRIVMSLTQFNDNNMVHKWSDADAEYFSLSPILNVNF